MQPVVFSAVQAEAHAPWELQQMQDGCDDAARDPAWSHPRNGWHTETCQGSWQV